MKRRKTTIPSISPEQILKGAEFELGFCLKNAAEEKLQWKGVIEKELRAYLQVRINVSDFSRIFEKATSMSLRRYGKLLTVIIIAHNRIPTTEFFRLAKELGVTDRIPFYNDRFAIAGKLHHEAFQRAKTVVKKQAEQSPQLAPSYMQQAF